MPHGVDSEDLCKLYYVLTTYQVATHLVQSPLLTSVRVHGRHGGGAAPLGPVWPPWGRGRSPGPRMAAVGAWPLPSAPPGRRGGVAAPGAPPCSRGGVAAPPGPVCPPWRRGCSPGPRMAAVGVWPVPWAPYGRRHFADLVS